MPKRSPFYVAYREGCTVIYATSEAAAAKKARAIFDRHSEPNTVRPAAPEDIDWVKGMGGNIHK